MQNNTLKPYVPLILTTGVMILMIIIVILTSLLRAPLPIPSPGVIYDLESGINVKTLGQQLADNGVIKHPWLFDAYIRMNGFDKGLQAGEYYFPQGITTRGVATKIFKGQVIKRFLRIQEGWTVNQMIHEIQSQPLIKQTIDYNTSDWYKSILSDANHPEGQFMPDTYVYKKGSTDLQLLSRMHKDLLTYLNEQWELRDRAVPYQSAYEALIVASIVEKETAIPSEREAVAGVLVRRLAKKMRLQMDPTVIYGLGSNYHGSITKNDLRSPTPYNTYLIDGLPPTPIALPSRQSIHAALHPLPGSSLYFVAKGDGSHLFSDTLEEHNAAVVKYILRQNKDTPTP